MRAALKTKAGLIIALVLAGGFTGVGRSMAAASPEASPTITICVHNYAKVDDNTLEGAETVTEEIFVKAGVGIRWVDSDLTVEGKPEMSVGKDIFAPCHIQLSILPSEMAERMHIPSNLMGLAPGSGTDRKLVCVFYNRVEAVSQNQLRVRLDKRTALYASKAKILGTAIAHELGHVLLNLEIHSSFGIMRGPWNTKDLMDVAFGTLCFTRQQAEIIRTEAQRRNMPQGSLIVAGIESPAGPYRR